MIVHKKQGWLPQYIGERQGTCLNISDLFAACIFQTDIYFTEPYIMNATVLPLKSICWFLCGEDILHLNFFLFFLTSPVSHKGIPHCSYILKSDVLFNNNLILLNAITVVHQELDIATNHLSDFTRRPTWKIWQGRWIIHFFISYLLIIKLPVTFFFPSHS